MSLFGKANSDPAKPEGALMMELPSRGKRKVLLLGLTGSGKSLTLWLSGHPTATEPSDEQVPATSGVQQLCRKAVGNCARDCSVDLELVEVGGNDQIRPYWKHYMKKDVDVLTFFVDMTDA